MNKEKFPFACCNCKQNFNIVRSHPPTFTPRNPLLIKCGHSVCEVCVRNGLKANGKVICNICAAITAIQEQFSVEALRREFPYFKYMYGTWTLRNFYDDCNVSFNLNQKRSALKQEPKFDPCFDCPLPAFFTCDQCEVNYCKNCFEKLHVTQPQYVMHTRSKAKPKNQQAKKVTFFKQPNSICQDHKNPKDFFCLDHDVAICSHCAIFQHSGHRVEEIAHRNKMTIPQLQESMRKAIVVLARIESNQKSVSAESAVKKFQSESIKSLQAIEREAAARFAKLNGLLQVRENEVFNKIREERASLLGAYSQLEDEMANSRNSVEALLKEGKDAVEKKGQNVNVLELIKALDELTPTIPSSMCIDNESSEQSSYKLEQMSDAQLTTAFKECLNQCFKFDCPTIPKIRLVPGKDISDEAKKEEMITNSERIAAMEKLYGVNEDVKVDASPMLSSLLPSRASESEKSDSIEGRSSPLILSRTLSALKEGSAELVSVAHITNPSEFYVHRKGVEVLIQENLVKINRLMAQSNLGTPSSVEKGGIYLAPSKTDDRWSRAKVLKSNLEDFPGKAQVHFIDYGSKELVEVSKFKILPNRLINEPAYAIECSLYDCHARGDEWPEEALKKMVELMSGCEVMMHVMNVTETGLEVDIVRQNDVNNISIRDALIFLELASFLPSRKSQITELPETQLCAKKNFAKGDILECQISYAVSPDEFYCVQIDEHYQQLLGLMNEMTELYSNVVERPNVVFNPVVGMAVAARFTEDDKWYRAVITGLPGNRLVDVFYVDFGNRERVDYTDVRELLTKFQRMNTQAIHCSLCDVQPVKKSKNWSETASKVIYDLILQPASLYIEEVKMIDNQPHVSVILFAITETADICINALLVERGAAISTGINSTKVTYNRVHNSKKLSKLRGYCKQADDIEPTEEPAAKQKEETVKKKNKKKMVKEKEAPERKESEASVNPDESDFPSSVSVASDSTHTKSVDGDAVHRVEVRVLSATSPGQFYVRLLNQDIENYINKLNMSLDQFYTGSVPSPITEWQKNGISVAFNPDDGHWYRCIIQGAVPQFDGEAYKVILKDIGVEKTIERKHLRPIEDRFVKGFTDGSIRCHLAGVLAAGGDKWASYSCDRFAEELNKYASVFITKKGKIDKEIKSLPVELWVKHVHFGGALEPDVEEWRSMNQFVVSQGLAIPDRTYEQYIAPTDDLLSELKQMQRDSSSDITSESFVISWLQSNDAASQVSDSQVSDSASEEVIQKMEVKTIQVKKSKKRAANMQESLAEWKPAAPLDKLELEIIPTNVNSDNMIFFHEVSHEETLKQIEQALLQSFKDSKPQPQDMFWSAGQTCIAQYHTNGMWYRGKIIKVNDDNSYSVQFVDYGNIEDCRAHELRKRALLSEFPLYCHTLYLADLKPVSADGKWPTDVLDFIHSNVVEKTCKVQLEERKEPNGAYIAKSFAPPGGIELSAILVGMHYAIRSSDVVEEDSSSTLSESSDDVVVVSTHDSNETENIAAVIAQKWSDEQINAPPDPMIDSIFASIMKPIDPADLLNTSLSNKSSKSSIAEELTLKSSNSSVIEEPTFNLSRGSKSSSSKSSIIEEKIYIPSAVKSSSKSSSSRSSLVGEKVNIASISLSVQVSDGPAIKIDPSEVSELSIESVFRQEEDSRMSKVQKNLKVDDDDSVAFQLKPTVEKPPEVKLSLEVEKESINEFGDFLEFPLPESEITFIAEVTALSGLTSYFIQINQTSNEFLQGIQNQYKEMFVEMQTEAPSGRPLLEPLRLGQECCALYDEDDNWYRAVIVERVPESDELLMVRFVDFGNKQRTLTKNLRPLKRKWMDIPRQCLGVTLHNIEMADGINTAMALALLFQIIFVPVTVIVKDHSRMAVELYKAGTEELVYQPLLDKGLLRKV